MKILSFFWLAWHQCRQQQKKSRRLVGSSDEDEDIPHEDAASLQMPPAAKKMCRMMLDSSDEDVPHGVDFEAVEVGLVPAHEDFVQYLVNPQKVEGTPRNAHNAVEKPTKRKDPQLLATTDSDDDVPMFSEKNGTEMLDLKAAAGGLTL
jgi:hypothetical protein